MKGNHKKSTGKYEEILLATIEKEPEELGYEFGRWTDQRLATYLGDQKGKLVIKWERKLKNKGNAVITV